MWFLQKLRGKMEEEEDPFEPKSQQQLPDSIDNDHLVQILAQDLQNLVLSCCNQLEAGGIEKVDPDEFRVLEDEDAREDERVQDLENQTKNVKAAYHYPLRLDAEDCAYYIRTGMCKFGSNCKFNHPLRRKNQPIKETKKQKEENVVERHAHTECKYHTSSAGCKYGKACKFNHGRGKSVKTPVAEYNFLGLPIRPGEKECPYYMRNGSCKYGPSCRFNHPDPTAVGGDDVPTTYANDAPTSYGNEGPLPLQPAPQPNIPNMPSWSAPRTPDPTAAFVPPMVYPPTQNMPPPNPDWNGYQAPAHLYPSSEQGLPIPPAFFLNNPQNNNTNMYTHHHQQQPMLVSEYPERPGQPDCSYFMKTGDCKYRTSCKFNHPQSRTTTTLRDQNICTYFSRHGTCKYGAACKYDHPVNYNSNSNPAREGYNGSNGPKSLIQQSV
ncbi:putative transcription factor C3H family [Helianthus debilis subsp. tardiflorus]